MFKVNYINNISLNEIMKLQSEYSFLRSAHIGNFNKQTLILADLGIHILLHEHLRGNAKVYEPSYMKYKNDKIKISDNDENILQLYDNKLNIEEKHEYKKPSQLHFNALKKISNNIELASEYLLSQIKFIKKILFVLVETFPEQLYRYQDNQGNSYDYIEKLENGDLKYKCYEKEVVIKKTEVVNEILKMLYSTEECIKSKEILNPEGIVINSRMYLLLFSICEVYKNRKGIQRFNSERVDIYHFAGTQMINYLCQNRKMSKENNLFFQTAYEKIYSLFPNDLPREINFNLISTSDLQYIGCIQEDNYKVLDKIFNNYKEILKLKNNKKNKVSFNIKEYVKELEKLDYIQFKQLINNLELMSTTYKKIVGLLDDFENNKKRIIGEIINYYKSSGFIIKDNEELVEKLNIEILNKEENIKKLILENLNLFYTEVSQYDLLKDNKKLYISNEVYDIDFKELERFSALVKGVKKNKEDNERKEQQRKKMENILYAPIQIKVFPIGEKQNEYSDKINGLLQKENFRVEIDKRDKKIGYKIREAQIQKIPYMIVLGEEEKNESVISVRERRKGNLGKMELNSFIDMIKNECQIDKFPK